MKKLENRYKNALKAIPYGNGTFRYRATFNTSFKNLIYNLSYQIQVLPIQNLSQEDSW